ncbi:glucose 1-dehydrogenase [Culicoidibacter larvae]|uniref:Glucose 1-dehydrogenase n=1 Tax=Culicoidibacter larvae TaxID=2579976 RepID=A0A5R8Q8L6_9FIRM|nr:glucose 1-dehydrogenase [Culicoidibacter larvae]TLG71545.1 glucose 1-dehydrogenase [Culicoidibacter larvae]
MKLANKTAIITGGASGIGRAIAETFAQNGANVVIADINRDRLEEVVAAITASGGSAASIVTDVTSSSDNEAMFNLALEKFGSYDILVCNAGIMDHFAPVGTLSDEMWQKLLAINTTGPMMQMRTAVNYFAAHGGGNIIVTGSVAGLGAGRSGAAYTASKHAVVGLALNTAFAYAKKGIRVNVIAPGGVATNIAESMQQLDPEGSQLFNIGAPLMPRLGEPTELAAVALFLASDEASFVNGAVIPVDGGWNTY